MGIEKIEESTLAGHQFIEHVRIVIVDGAGTPGAFGKWTFLDMFRWVREKGYETDEHFQKYHARRIQELHEAGRLDAE